MSANNPYSSPMSQSSFPAGGQTPQVNSFVKQVPIVGILMMVVGFSEILMGVFYLVIGIFMPQFIEQAQAQAGGKNQMTPAESAFVRQILFWVYFGMGAGGLIGGLVRSIAGIQIFRFRSRTLGIIGNIAGLLSMSTCYCTPLSIGISVYGLIVLFQKTVRDEFTRRSGRFN